MIRDPDPANGVGSVRNPAKADVRYPLPSRIGGKEEGIAKETKYRVGQVVAISLPNRKFAYAKVFNDFDLGVYDFSSDEIEPLERVVRKKFAFFSAVTDRAVKSGAFTVIGEQPFVDEESAWAPPMASGVFPGFPGVGVLHIDHKGTSRRATPQEAAGMYVRGFSQRPDLFVDEIVDRLVNGNNHKYRV